VIAAALVACGTSDPPPALSGRVVRVVDGDTIRVRLESGRVERVRYIGIDTPEAGACFEPPAHAFNARLVGAREVRLVRDVDERDRYGRLLAYVYSGGTFVNAELVRRGYAEPLVVPPNVRYAGRFAALAGAARRAHRGLWGACARAGLHGAVQAS
jgi:micrococcal nuclease